MVSLESAQGMHLTSSLYPYGSSDLRIKEENIFPETESHQPTTSTREDGVRSPIQAHFQNILQMNPDDYSSCTVATSGNGTQQLCEHKCVDCGKSFTERTLLQRHRVAHAEAKHICEFCQRAFVREDKLRRHIRCVHIKEKPFVCEVCSKAFARKDKLQEHARHHNRDITFPCPLCAGVFIMRSHLNKHLRTEHKLKQQTISALQKEQHQHQRQLLCPSTSSFGSTVATEIYANPPNNDSLQTLPNTNINNRLPFAPIDLNTTGEDKLGTAPGKRKRQGQRRSTAKKMNLNELDSSATKLQSGINYTALQSSRLYQPHQTMFPSAFRVPGASHLNFPTNWLFGASHYSSDPPVPWNRLSYGQLEQQQHNHHQQQLLQHYQQQQQQQQQLNVHSQQYIKPFTNNPCLDLNSATQSFGQQRQQYEQSSTYGSLPSSNTPSQLQHQYPPSALSAAAMAAGIFPVNYMNFWSQQSNCGLLLPPHLQQQPSTAASVSSSSPGTSGQLSTDAENIPPPPPPPLTMASNVLSTSILQGQSVLNENTDCSTNQLVQQPYFPSVNGLFQLDQHGQQSFPFVTPSTVTIQHPANNMIASLPTFAQAVYQAASLAGVGTAITDPPTSLTHYTNHNNNTDSKASSVIGSDVSGNAAFSDGSSVLALSKHERPSGYSYDSYTNDRPIF